MRIAHFTPLLLLLIPAAAAQDGCDLSEQNPCAIGLNTDPGDGVYFSTPAEITYNVTQGDWLSFDVFNWYDETHTLVLEGHDTSFEAESLLDASWGPIQFNTPGVFEVRDETTGDFAVLVVQEGDVATSSSPEASAGAEPGEDSPGLSLIALLGVVSLIALRRR